MELEDLTELELLRFHGSIVSELRRRSVCRTSNNPVADYTDTDHIGAQGNQPRAQAIRRLAMKENYNFSQGKRGAVDQTPKRMTRITIPLDDDTLDWFRQQVDSAGGGNYLTLINKALAEYVKNRREPLEETVCRVVREELSSSRAARRKSKQLPSRKAS